MRFNRNFTISLVTIALTVTSLFSIASAGNLDDGYPQGQPAPGRTCPAADEGTKAISEH